MGTRRCIQIAVAWLCTILAANAPARTWYVARDATGDAPTIRAAIDSAQAGDDILVGPGTYTHASEGAGLSPPGFAIVELPPYTILRSELGPSVTILDVVGGNGRGIYCEDCPGAQVEGFTITNGSAFGNSGGGVWLAATEEPFPVLRNCTVQGNCERTQREHKGGGIAAWNAHIVDCRILDNCAPSGGGGIYCVGGTISRCSLRGNFIPYIVEWPGGRGSAILAQDTTIENCWIEANRGTAIDLTGGVIRNCMLRDNVEGGAIVARNCGVENCILIRNRGSIPATGVGATFSGCTVMANVDTEEPYIGGLNMFGGSVERTTVALNDGAACGGTATWSCCDLYGNTRGDEVCGTDGGGNFSADPEFCAVDPLASLNFFLQQDSPCAPGNHPRGEPCGLVGAMSVACATVSVERITWSHLKRLYR